MDTLFDQTDIPPLKFPGLIFDPSSYVMSEGLASAVRVSVTLGVPLLITGEPGCGKSKLAYHLAYRFNQDKPLVFNVKTTSTAKDLFYQYDALSHYRDIQSGETKAKNKSNYITLNALGNAIKSNKRKIVLIDEIDKAPRDLTNDILNDLEDLTFTIDETGEVFKSEPQNRPVIIFCSNSEKQLPDPFLRRCVFFHIKFPDTEQLKQILIQRTGLFTENDSSLTKLVDLFIKIRSLPLKKSPATDELLKWAMYLRNMEFNISKLSSMRYNLSEEDKDFLLSSFTILVKSNEDLDRINELFNEVNH